jgi:hypothetical protein
MSDETTPVTVHVAGLTPAYGKGRLKFTTCVTLSISDIEVVLQGVAIVADKNGNLSVLLPQTRHPVSGAYYPCIAVPLELHRAIEVAVLELVPVSRVIVTEGAAS